MSDEPRPALTPEYSMAKGIWKGVRTGALILGTLVLEQAAREGSLEAVLPTKYQGLAAVLGGLARVLLNRQKHA